MPDKHFSVQELIGLLVDSYEHRISPCRVAEEESSVNLHGQLNVVDSELGWDWAPYSNTYQTGVRPGGGAATAHTLSFGIWKSVYIVEVCNECDPPLSSMHAFKVPVEVDMPVMIGAHPSLLRSCFWPTCNMLYGGRKVGATALVHVVPHTFYRGDDFPVAPLTDGNHAGFDVQIRCHFWTHTSTTGTLTAQGSWSRAVAAVQKVSCISHATENNS